MARKISKKFTTAFRAPSEVADAPPAAAREPVAAADTLIRVDLDRQRLELHVGGRSDTTYPVSTAANGPGEREGSECTPCGMHVIRAKIGAGAAPGPGNMSSPIAAASRAAASLTASRDRCA